MTSEIRTNSLKSRAGMSTVTMTDTGPMFSGITTFVDNSGFTFGVGGGTSIFTPATNVLTFGTNNTEKIRIDASGHMHGVGVITATHFYGDGSNLTGISADVVDDTSPQLGGDLASNSHDILFADNDKAIFGTGSDFKIYHNGTHNYLMASNGDYVFDTGSAERLRINSNGHLSVGGSNVTDVNLLTLNGSGAAQNVGIVFNKTNSPARAYGVNVNNTSGALIFYDYTASTERLRIAPNGDIGLGTVPETDSYQPSLYFSGGNANIWGSGNANLYSCVNARYTGAGGWKYNNNGVASYVGQQSGVWNFFNAPSGTADATATFTERLRITSGGQVNIGNALSNTSRMLAVETTHASGGEIAYFGNNDGSNNYGGLLISGGETDRECRLESAFGNSFMTFHTNSGEKLVINADGMAQFKGKAGSYYGVPYSNNHHQFNNTGSGHWICQMRQEHHNGLGLNIRMGSTGNQEALQVYYYGSGASTRFRVLNNGNVGSASNSYGGVSDIKLKDNIVDAKSQWDDIKALKVRNFNFKDTPDTKMLGVVAQEIETVSPGLVSDMEDKDPDTNESLGTTTKEVKYSILYMKAIKCLQEAQARIEKIEEDNIALRARVTNLEGN